jgi:hypothetical protein
VKEYSPLSESEQLKLIYHDITNGYTFNSGIYVAHFSERGYAKVLQRKMNLVLSYKEQGLPTKEEREKEIVEQELWTKEKDDRILQLKYLVSDNEKYAQGMVVPAQKEAILKMVAKDKSELFSLSKEKESVLGPTSESFADKELENSFLLEFFYKDPDLKDKYFSESDIDEMDHEELTKFKKILNISLNKVKDEDITKIGCMPFFLNSLSFVKDRPEAFFSRPLTKATFHQQNLLGTGLRNLNVQSQSEGSPPSLIDSSIEDLVKWYDQAYSVMLGKSGKNGAGGGLKINSQDVIKN